MPAAGTPRPTYRRSGGDLVASLSCEGHLHRVRITAAALVVTEDHDEPSLALLDALGGPPLPCQQVRLVARAASQWVALQARTVAPPGRFDVHWGWTPDDLLPCCVPHRSAATPRASRQGASQRIAISALHHHARSTAHVAALHGVAEPEIRRVGAFLADATGTPTGRSAAPGLTRSRMALLPARLSEVAVENIWALGVTDDFLQAYDVARAAAPRSPERAPHPQRVANAWVSELLEWWRLGVDSQWLRAVAAYARQHRPSGASASRHRYAKDWTRLVPAWSASHLPADTIGAYLAAGVSEDLPALAEHNISPGRAAAFQRAADGGRHGGLASWLRDGVDAAAAEEVIRHEPSCPPPGRDVVRAGLAAIAEHRGGPVHPDDLARATGVIALVRTPKRAARWEATGLTVEEVARALRDGLPPARAAARAARARRATGR